MNLPKERFTRKLVKNEDGTLADFYQVTLPINKDWDWYLVYKDNNYGGLPFNKRKPAGLIYAGNNGIDLPNSYRPDLLFTNVPEGKVVYVTAMNGVKTPEFKKWLNRAVQYEAKIIVNDLSDYSIKRVHISTTVGLFDDLPEFESVPGEWFVRPIRPINEDSCDVIMSAACLPFYSLDFKGYPVPKEIVDFDEMVRSLPEI